MIPNQSAAAFADQAAPDAADFQILQDAYAGTGVVSGCAVTAQGTPNMTVAVAAGVVQVLDTLAAVTAGNVTIAAANATNPRFDLIVASSTGVLSAVSGTAAAAPEFPAIPVSSVVLAAIRVAAATTTIASTAIVDKRVTVQATRDLGYAESRVAVSTSTNLAWVDVTGCSFTMVAPGGSFMLDFAATWAMTTNDHTIIIGRIVDITGAATEVGRGKDAISNYGAAAAASIAMAGRLNAQARITGVAAGTSKTYKAQFLGYAVDLAGGAALPAALTLEGDNGADKNMQMLRAYRGK